MGEGWRGRGKKGEEKGGESRREEEERGGERDAPCVGCYSIHGCTQDVLKICPYFPMRWLKRWPPSVNKISVFFVQGGYLFF